MTNPARRIVTGHDEGGKSVVLSDGPPPQHHAMHGRVVGADFLEMWSVTSPIPALSSAAGREPNEGEVVLVLDDSEVTLKKSDVVVQRGTNHAWENRSEQPARMVFFHIDAAFGDELLAKLPQPLELLR